MWKTQFKALLNCVTTDTHKSATIYALSAICNDNYMEVTPDMMSVAIRKLKCGKACGSDRLFAEHYIHADSGLAIVYVIYQCSHTCACPGRFHLTRFNKIAIQGTPQMAVDKEAICLSRVYSYYPKCNFPLFYV